MKNPTWYQHRDRASHPNGIPICSITEHETFCIISFLTNDNLYDSVHFLMKVFIVPVT